MKENMYPHWLRAIRVQEGAVWMTQKNAPRGTWDSVLSGDAVGPILGDLRRGFVSCACPESEVDLPAHWPDTAMVSGVQLLDIYGTDMRALCVKILRVLEDAGADVLGISLSTQRMSVVVQEDGPWLDRLCENFPMDL